MSTSCKLNSARRLSRNPVSPTRSVTEESEEAPEILTPSVMAYGGVPNHTDDMAEITDLSTPGSSTTMTASAQEVAGAALAHDLVHQLGQFSLDSSPVLAAKVPKFSRKYSLRDLEIQQTIGRSPGGGRSVCVTERGCVLLS